MPLLFSGAAALGALLIVLALWQGSKSGSGEEALGNAVAGVFLLIGGGIVLGLDLLGFLAWKLL